MIDLFTTEYDINLIDTVDKLRMSSCYLYSNLDYKNPKKISVLVNNAITNIIIAILTFNGEISNRHQLKMNYYNYLDIAEKSYKNEDHHTAIVIRAALNTLSITRLNIKLRKKPVYSRNETSRYSDLLPNGKSRQFSFLMESKSIILKPSPGVKVNPGLLNISGIAWSGTAKIKKSCVTLERTFTRISNLLC